MYLILLNGSYYKLEYNFINMTKKNVQVPTTKYNFLEIFIKCYEYFFSFKYKICQYPFKKIFKTMQYTFMNSPFQYLILMIDDY